jgi:hypothetical protein
VKRDGQGRVALGEDEKLRGQFLDQAGLGALGVKICFCTHN